MNLWTFAIFCFSLFELTSCAEEVIKTATFKDFWYKSTYLVYGTGETFAENGRICTGGAENEVWLITKTLNINQTLYDLKLHIEIESQMDTCDNREGVCFRDGFELFTYSGTEEPKVPFNAKNQANLDAEKQKAREFLHKNFIFLGNITGNATRKERVNTTFTINLKEFRGITFGIKSRGGCGNVIRMKVYYYICDVIFINSVMFKKTLAPQNGTKDVIGNCSANTRSVSRKGDLTAYCHSNGSWSTERDRDMVCICDKGYESTTDHGCSACQSGWYKPMVSNEKCMKCPQDTENARNNTIRTTCVCKKGHYKLPRDMKSKNPSRCYAPIKIEGEPIVKQLYDSFNSVNITWLAPVNDSEIEDEEIVYDILCYICVASFCNKSCTGLSYTPSQYNITRTRVRVSGLLPGQIYQFKIFPKNSLNTFVPRVDWEFTESKPFTFQSKNEESNVTAEGSISAIIISVIIMMTLAVVVFLSIMVVFLVKYKRLKRASKLSTPHNIPLEAAEVPQESLPIHQEEPGYETVPRVLQEFYNDVDTNANNSEGFYEMVGEPSDAHRTSEYGTTDENETYEEPETSSQSPGYAELDKNRVQGRNTTDDSNYHNLVKRNSDYVIPAHERRESSQHPGYAELDTNKLESRNTTDDSNYQKLVKRDSDYVIQAHERRESYEDIKMGRNQPGYTELDQIKRKAEDYPAYQKLQKPELISDPVCELGRENPIFDDFVCT